jgi:hypothetical protein
VIVVRATVHFSKVLAFYINRFGVNHYITWGCRQDHLEALNEETRGVDHTSKGTYHRPLVTATLCALARQIGASLGYTNVPRITSSDGRGPPSSGPTSRVSKRTTKSRPLALCSQCKGISMNELLKTRVKTVKTGREWQDPPLDHNCRPLTLAFQDPLGASETCPLCRLILGYLAKSTTPIFLGKLQ